MTLTIVYTTFENRKSAEKIISDLVRKKLAGCVNLFPVEGIYLWNNKLQKEKEVAAIIKTSNKAWPKLKKYLEKNHPYDIPCILKFSAESNKIFESWTNKQVK